MSIDQRSQGPAGTHSGSESDRQSPSTLDEEAVAHFEALAQRIADTRSRLTPAQLKLIEAFGF